MNWLTKLIRAGEKIKTAIRDRATKEDIEKSDWTSCCRGPILKTDLEKNLWVCPDCNKHHRIKPCLLYTSPSPRDVEEARMPSSA